MPNDVDHRTVVLRILALAVPLMLSACASSGGGGNSGGSDPDEEENDGDTPSQIWHLEAVGADRLHAGEIVVASSSEGKAVTGEGARVAVIDSGVWIEHNEFEEGRVVDQYDFEPGEGQSDDIANDNTGHGTSVASVAVGNNQGVAPGAYLLAYSVGEVISPMEGAGGFELDAVAAALDRAVEQGAEVINMSMSSDISNSDSHPVPSAVGHALDNDVFIAWAAGNSGNDTPGEFASDGDSLLGCLWGADIDDQICDDVGENLDGLITVGGVDGDLMHQPFWNRSKDGASETHIVAPAGDVGGEVQAAGIENEEELIGSTDTSMAAPMVAGAAALIRGEWPHLSAGEVRQILLDTASEDALGEEYDPDRHGQGMLDVVAAMSVQGSPQVQTSNGTSHDASTSYMVASSAMGDALIDAEALSDAAVLDAYGRDFSADLSGAVIAPMQRHSALDFLRRQGVVAHAIPEFSGYEGLRVTAGYSAGSGVASRANDLGGFDHLSLALQNESQSMRFDAGVDPGRFFGGGVGATRALMSARGHPLMAHLDHGAISQVALPVVGSDRLTVYSRMGQARADYGQALNDAEVQMVSAGLQQRIGDYLRLALEVEQHVERDGFQGGSGSGALSVADEVSSQIYRIALERDLPGDWRIGGQAYVGQSELEGDGLFNADGTTVHTRALLAHATRKLERGALGIAYHEPARIVRGRASVDVPTGIDDSGNLEFTTHELDLTPSGQQRDVEVFLQHRLAHKWRMSANMAYHLEPGHVADADPAWSGLVTLNTSF